MPENGKLSAAAEETINRFRYYFDNKKSFALIGEYVIAELSDENSNDMKKLEQEALENISQMLQCPPDFSTYVMDDMFGLVRMNYGIYGVSSEPLSDEEISSGKMNLAGALIVRSLILEACENGKIIAIFSNTL